MTKILLIEDNALNCEMLSRRLENRGFDVVAAENGSLGLRAAHTEAPDLILMDMSLPEMDGWELTRRLKADLATRQIPIIALTAHAMSGDREAALRAGCDDYDTKPVDLPGLLKKMEALLPRRIPDTNLPASAPASGPFCLPAQALVSLRRNNE